METSLPDPKQDETFRVIDRRLFNPDGGIRDEAVRNERQKSETDSAATGAAAGAGGTVGASGGADATQRPVNTPTQQPAAGPTLVQNAIKPSRPLQMLINFVAQNAAMLLGAYPDPRTGEAMLDLEGARELVDMLDALREATSGNLATEDERLLVDIIASLKLSFMEMTKASSAAMPDKTKARP
jgi:hypothetical protein